MAKIIARLDSGNKLLIEISKEELMKLLEKNLDTNSWSFSEGQTIDFSLAKDHKTMIESHISTLNSAIENLEKISKELKNNAPFFTPKKKKNATINR